MKKIFIVIQREYFTRVKKKSFILTTFLAPLSIFILMLVPVLLSEFSGDSKQRICVIDESSLFVNKIADTKSMYFFYESHHLDSLKNNYKDLGFTGILSIPKMNFKNPKTFTYYAETQLPISARLHVTTEIEKELRTLRIEDAGLDTKLLNSLKVNISLESKVLSEEGEKTGNTIIATAAGGLAGFAIYMILLIYGTLVMRGVMEEKTSRIVEVIMSSIKPFQLMMGKILGIAAVGLTQAMLWVIIIFIFQLIGGLIFQSDISQLQDMINNPVALEATSNKTQTLVTLLEGLQNLNYPLLIFSFIFYFLGGYLFYAAFFAALGSAADDDGDIQSMTFVVTIPIIISFFLFMVVIENPYSTLAFWASVIPFTSPIVMVGRIPFGIPAWEIVTSMITLIIGFIFATWMAAKIYRTGILLYGKKVTLRELGRWLTYK